MSFSEFWAKCLAFQSGPGRTTLTQVEAATMYDCATSLQAGATCMVEVGSFRGLSTSLLASCQPDMKVIAFDPLEAGHDVGGYKIGPLDVDIFKSVLLWQKNIEWWRCGPEDRAGWACTGQKIGLTYIDGRHASPWPQKDYNELREWLMPGAWVLFHDYYVTDETLLWVKGDVDSLVRAGQIEQVSVVGGLFVGKQR